MKKIIFALLIVFTCKISAQEQTLLSGTITHGGYGGPEVKFTQIGDNFGVLVGGKGGWIVNHTFVIGGGGYGLVNNIETDYIYNNQRTVLNFGYGGLILEYIQNPDQILHYTFSALVGGGGINYRFRNGGDLGTHGTKTFFILEPAANAEVNISTFFRVNLGISYRLLSNVEFDRFNQDDLGGISANLTLKFGKF